MTFTDRTLTSDPASDALQAKVGGLFSSLTMIPTELGKLATDLRKQLLQHQIDNSARLTPAAIHEEQAVMRNEAMRRVDAIYRMAESLRADVLTAVAEATATPPEDDTAALLRETREMRAWERMRGELDRATDAGWFGRAVQQLGKDAMDRRDDAAIAALRTEVDAYAKARGFPPHNLPAQLRAMQAAALPPVARMGGQIEDNLTLGWARLLAAFAMVRRELTDDRASRSCCFRLPPWRSGHVRPGRNAAVHDDRQRAQSYSEARRQRFLGQDTARRSSSWRTP